MVKPPTLLINPKYRRMLAFFQLKKDNKNYKRLYTKIKKNNCALAKALSEEKRVSRSLLKESDAQRVEIQNLNLALRRNEDTLQNVGLSAKETLKGIKSMTDQLVFILTSCQSFNHTPLPQKPTRKSSINRRLSVKSPARGVVQPMVSGHTITKPTINLRRVNMDHFRNVNNMSAIEESPRTTPNQSPQQNQSVTNTPQVPPTNHQSFSDHVRPRASTQSVEGEGSASVNNSIRVSSERRSRKRFRKSLDNSEVGSTSQSLVDELIRSPQVRLNVNEVSKYLQGSRSNNVTERGKTSDMSSRTPVANIPLSSSTNSDCSRRARRALKRGEMNLSYLMRKEEQLSSRSSASNDSREEAPLGVTRDEVTLSPTDDSSLMSRKEEEEEKEELSGMRSNSASLNLALDGSSLSKKSRARSEGGSNGVEEENPLEGTSWMHRDSSCGKSRGRKRVHFSGDTSSTDDEGEYARVYSRHNFVKPRGNNWPKSARENCAGALGDWGDMEKEEEEDVAVNLRDDGNFVNCLDRRRNFVTRKRGSVIDDDEFTMCLNKRNTTVAEHFDINQFKLPVLVNPMSTMPTATINADTEITSNLNGVTQNLPLPLQERVSMRDSVFGNMSLKLMPIDSDMDFTMNGTKLPQTPGVQIKQKHPELVQEMKASPEQKAADKRAKKKGRPPKVKRLEKDPSTAKVVLQKLNDSGSRMKVPSTQSDSQDQSSYLENVAAHQTGGSDSESSSCSSVTAYGRPRRKKAPTSFKEPSLNTKMRRDK